VFNNQLCIDIDKKILKKNSMELNSIKIAFSLLTPMDMLFKFYTTQVHKKYFEFEINIIRQSIDFASGAAEIETNLIMDKSQT